MEFGKGRGRGVGRGSSDLMGAGGAMRRTVTRRTIDHLSPGVQLLKDRVLRPEMRAHVTTIVSSETSVKELLPPSAYPMQPTYSTIHIDPSPLVSPLCPLRSTALAVPLFALDSST